MNERFLMRPGDTFVAEECGCSFTVASGPSDENMASQAPRCCCGHEMVKQDTEGIDLNEDTVDDGHVGSPPRAMAD